MLLQVGHITVTSIVNQTEAETLETVCNKLYVNLPTTGKTAALPTLQHSN